MQCLWRASSIYSLRITSLNTSFSKRSFHSLNVHLFQHVHETHHFLHWSAFVSVVHVDVPPLDKCDAIKSTPSASALARGHRLSRPCERMRSSRPKCKPAAFTSARCNRLATSPNVQRCGCDEVTHKLQLVALACDGACADFASDSVVTCNFSSVISTDAAA